VVIALAVLLAIAAAAFVVAGQGVYETYPRTALYSAAGRAAAPRWTVGCRARRPPAPGRVCANVSGRVVWRQAEDPDGDGDRHLMLVVRRHVRLVKLSRYLTVPRLPRLGTTIRATGYIMRGSHGRDEVDAERLTMSGHRYRWHGPEF
jgi:hypothetical protein